VADDPNQIVDRFDKQNRQALQYGRHRFLWTWLAVGLLAVLTAISLEVAVKTAHRQNESTKVTAVDASATADEAKASNDEVVKYLKGEQGIPGVPGANGKNGSPGLPSSEPGPEGPRGVAGPAGTPGTIGPPGAASTVSGPAGAAGTVGPTGTPGEAGTAGEAGAQGPQGAKGDTGSRGDTGPAGPTGPPGPAGPASSLSTSVAIGSSANDTATHKTALATCPAGTRATGGGFALIPSDPGLDVSASSPVGNTGWNATADQLSLPPGTVWQLLAFAICSQ
jgi:Collagen triple helix repeat (20 copies)